jgi:hypothetical protein
MFAEARFRTPWVDDEFAALIRTARQWLHDNPCPDDSLGRHFARMLDAYAEMTSATVARVMELRVIIEQEVRALDHWKPPSARIAPSSGDGSGSRTPYGSSHLRAPAQRENTMRRPQFQGSAARADQ